MPQYIIKTVRDRNLVIEADRYNYNATEETYEFFKKTENADTLRVATVPRSPEILAVVQDEVEQADFYYVEDWNDEDEENIELDLNDDSEEEELFEEENPEGEMI